MKKKINRVNELIAEYIISRTINIWEILTIFKPYIVCERKDEHITPLVYSESNSENEKTNLLAVFSFKINKHVVKRNNLRYFRMDGTRYYIWLKQKYDKNTQKTIKEITINSSEYFNFRRRELTLYHLLTVMKRLIPDCLIQIEVLLLRKL
jgi:hypothetical protein